MVTIKMAVWIGNTKYTGLEPSAIYILSPIKTKTQPLLPTSVWYVHLQQQRKKKIANG